MDRRDSPYQHKPSLLCLNIGPEWISDDRSWTEAALKALIHARENEWRIAHCYCRSAPGGSAPAPAPRFEPTTSEPAFNVYGVSAFHGTAVWQWTGLSAPPIYVIGSVFGLIGAATVVGAHVLGVPITLIAEACGEAADGHTQAGQTRDHICGLTRTVSLARALQQEAPSNVIEFTPARVDKTGI